MKKTATKQPLKKAATKKVATKKGVTKATTKGSLRNAEPLQDNFIDLSTAIAFVNNGSKLPTLDYPKAIIQEILNQEDVQGIRIYSAVNSNGENTFVITGYDTNKNDVYINRGPQQGAADLGQPCDPGMPSYQQATVQMLFNA